MTSRFLNFIPFILEWETVYNKNKSVKVENDPDDPGGTTKFGIDKRSHPHVDIPRLTKELATQIYFEEWEMDGCEKMPDRLGEAYFNCCVNCGIGRARKIVAIAKSDGVEFIEEQEAFYHRLVDARPKSQKYLKGWLNRTRALKKFLNL